MGGKKQYQRERKVTPAEENQPAGPTLDQGVGVGLAGAGWGESHLSSIVGGPLVIREL